MEGVVVRLGFRFFVVFSIGFVVIIIGTGVIGSFVDVNVLIVVVMVFLVVLAGARVVVATLREKNIKNKEK